MENEATGRIVYKMFFLGCNFVSGLYTVKPSKT